MKKRNIIILLSIIVVLLVVGILFHLQDMKKNYIKKKEGYVYNKPAVFDPTKFGYNPDQPTKWE